MAELATALQARLTVGGWRFRGPRRRGLRTATVSIAMVVLGGFLTPVEAAAPVVGPEGRWHFLVDPGTLECQAATTPPPGGSTYLAWSRAFGVGYCGTFLKVDGVVYGTEILNGEFLNQLQLPTPFTMVSDEEIDGGTKTVVKAGDSGVLLTQTDTYNERRDGWVTNIEVTRTEPSDNSPIWLFHIAGTCWDYSQGRVTSTYNSDTKDTACNRGSSRVTFKQGADDIVYTGGQANFWGHRKNSTANTFSMTSEIVWSHDVSSSELPPDGGSGSGPRPGYYGTDDPQSAAGGSSPDTNVAQCSCADPINTATGELWTSATDLELPGRLPVTATRTYSSLRSEQPGLFGRGWASPWDMHLDVDVDEDGNGSAAITHENGARTVIPAIAGEGFVPDPDTFATLTHDPWGGQYQYLYIRRKTETFVFDRLGDLVEIRDRNGEVTTLMRGYDEDPEPDSDPALESLTVQSSDGRVLVADLNPDGTVATLTGPEGRTVSYNYDTDGQLTEVVDARGQSWTYQYDEQGLMTHETDPSGATTLTEYDDGRAVSQENPRGGTTTFDYTMDPATGMSSSTRVTDPTGVATVVSYDHGQLVEKKTGPNDNPAVWRYEYDNNGDRTLAEDPTGNRTYSSYDTSGNLIRQVSPAGGVTKHTYNEFNQVLTTTDPRDNLTAYEYDARGNLLSVNRPRDGIGALTEYQRDSGHPADILKVTDPDGRTLDLAYDAAGFEISSATGDGATSTTTRNAYGQGLARTTPRGNAPGATAADFTTTFTYDDGGLLTATEDAVGRTTTYGHDAKGRVRTVTAPDAGTTTTSYGPDDTVASVTDPGEHTTNYDYDDAGRLLSSTTPRGARTSYTYDDYGYLSSITRPLGNRPGATSAEKAAHTITIERTLAGQELRRIQPNPADPAEPLVTQNSYVDGRVVGTTNPAGERTDYDYDLADNLTTITDATGAATSYTYDEWGAVTQVRQPGHGVPATTTYSRTGLVTATTDAEGGTTTYTYDDAGQLAATVDPRGNCDGCDPAEYTSSITRDLDGNVLTETDALGHTTTYTYDAVGRPKQVTNHANQTTSYAYDAADRLRTITAADGGVTTYEYDPTGHLGTVRNPRLKTTAYAYNADGALISRTDPLGRQRTWSYDLNGNLTNVVTARGTATPATAAAGTITYAYDSLDRLASTSFGDSAPTVTYGYDGAARPVSITDAAGTQTRTYDDAGRVTTISRTGSTWAYTYNPDGTTATVTRPDNSVETWTYNGAGRATKVVAPNGTTTFGYDPAGNLTWTDHPNATRETQTYDPAGNVTKIATTRKSDGVEIVSHTIARDDVDNPTQVVTKRGTTTSTRSFLYDPNQRLTGVCYTALTTCTTTNATQAWTYDLNGNRLTEKNGTGTGTTTTYTYDNADQLTTRKIGTAAATTLTYDADGNLLTDAASSWTYDLQNRAKTSTASGTTTTWQRDFEGNLLKQTVGSNATTFTWDTSSEVPQLAAVQAGSTSTNYRYDPAGRPANVSSGTTRQTVAHDLVGAPTDLISTSRVIVRSYDYTPFGASRTAPGGPGTPSGTPSHLQFGAMLTANPAVPTSYITRGRVYDPSNARWTGTDPVPPPLARSYDSTYTYVGNQPTRYIDPVGEMCNINPFSSSENTCGLYDHVAETISGDNPAGWVSDFLVNVGRGATAGATDIVADYASDGASCTVTDDGFIAISGQVFGTLAPGIPSGITKGGRAAVLATKSVDEVAQVRFRSDTSHIFRNATGHLAEDTAENRALIQSAIHPDHLRETITLNDGTTLQKYFRDLPDGTQSWAEVRNGQITNGGLNVTPR